MAKRRLFSIKVSGCALDQERTIVEGSEAFHNCSTGLHFVSTTHDFSVTPSWPATFTGVREGLVMVSHPDIRSREYDLVLTDKNSLTVHVWKYAVGNEGAQYAKAYRMREKGCEHPMEMIMSIPWWNDHEMFKDVPINDLKEAWSAAGRLRKQTPEMVECLLKYGIGQVEEIAKLLK